MRAPSLVVRSCFDTVSDPGFHGVRIWHRMALCGSHLCSDVAQLRVGTADTRGLICGGAGGGYCGRDVGIVLRYCRSGIGDLDR